MVAASEGCWFDSSISVCTVDHFCTVSFYPTIAGNKFRLHSLTSRNHFLNLEFTLDAVFVLFGGASVIPSVFSSTIA